jgi:7,8-dihydro-6-hydroxymethylpterin-pyrophosphokinase
VIAPLSGLSCAYVDVVYARRHMHRRKLPAQATQEQRRRQERRERKRWSNRELDVGI